MTEMNAIHSKPLAAAKLRRLEAEFPGVRGHVCDMADAKAVQDFAAEVIAGVGGVDLLISNAGGLREIDLTSPPGQGADLHSEIRTNLEGPINLLAAFLPALLKAGKASVVIVSSGYALAPPTRAPIYSASKAGLHSYAKALRRQLAPLGIAVTEVLPPVVDTPAVAHREVAKISPGTVVRLALEATSAGKAEVYPGQARFLPLLLRLAPSLAERIVANS
jgi:uncharacterized oxidoreductase